MSTEIFITVNMWVTITAFSLKYGFRDCLYTLVTVVMTEWTILCFTVFNVNRIYCWQCQKYCYDIIFIKLRCCTNVIICGYEDVYNIIFIYIALMYVYSINVLRNRWCTANLTLCMSNSKILKHFFAATAVETDIYVSMVWHITVTIA